MQAQCSGGLGWGAQCLGDPVSLSCPRLRSLEKPTHSHKLKWEAPPQGAGGAQGCGIRLWLTLSPVALGRLLSLSEPVSSFVKQEHTRAAQACSEG